MLEADSATSYEYETTPPGPPSDLDTISVFTSPDCTSVIVFVSNRYASGLEGVDLEGIEDEGIITDVDLALPVKVDVLAEKLLSFYNDTISPRAPWAAFSAAEDRNWLGEARFLKVFYKVFPSHALNNAAGVLKMIYRLEAVGGEQNVRAVFDLLLETFYNTKVSTYLDMPSESPNTNVNHLPPGMKDKMTLEELYEYLRKIERSKASDWMSFLYEELRDGNYDSDAIADEFIAKHGSMPDEEELPRPSKPMTAGSRAVAMGAKAVRSSTIPKQPKPVEAESRTFEMEAKGMTSSVIPKLRPDATPELPHLPRVASWDKLFVASLDEDDASGTEAFLSLAATLTFQNQS